MRVSKDPLIRKQEMIDTAMRLFASKGYEATSMTDIAKEMHVVSSLCYRYFKSKEELYETALTEYAKECAAPIITQLQKPYHQLSEVIEAVYEVFCQTDGKERYHAFFHGEGNRRFHYEMELQIIDEVLPHMEALLLRLKEEGEITVEDCKGAAEFVLYGQMPVINDDSLRPEEKAEAVIPYIKKILL